MYKKYFKASLLLAALALNACKDKGEDSVTPGCKEQAVITTGLVNTSENLYLVNEGNFTTGDGTIGFYNSVGSQPKYAADLFKPSNCASLGSVVQSLKFYQGKGYITVQGNTGRIEVIDSATFARQATVTSISAPQYLEPVSATKAYVTNWGTWTAPENEIAVMNLTSNSVTKRIAVLNNPQQMLRVGNEIWLAYASFANGNQLTVLNIQTDAVAATVTLPADSLNRFTSPSAMVLDASGKIWVLCAGVDDFSAPANNSAGALLKIDPASRQVLAAFPFSSNSTHPRHLATSPDRTQLYYEYNGSVYQMSASASALPAAPLITPQTSNFYGLSVSPTNGNIYVADGSFTGNSRVLVYKPSGVSQGEITTGVGTNKVVVK
jgi:sugar lactone lactonase YvrE